MPRNTGWSGKATSGSGTRFPPPSKSLQYRPHPTPTPTPTPTPIPITVTAQVVSTTIPISMYAGTNSSVSVTMRNTGNVPWNETSRIRLGGVGDATGDAAKFGPTPYYDPWQGPVLLRCSIHFFLHHDRTCHHWVLCPEIPDGLGGAPVVRGPGFLLCSGRTGFISGTCPGSRYQPQPETRYV